MTGELIQTTTSDQLILHGFYCFPSTKSNSTCIIHIHGAYGNFYDAEFLSPIANQYNQQGFAFLSINTRGHDYYADIKQSNKEEGSSRTIGGVREIFGESELDIDAWIAYALSLGHTQIILQGHSLGAMKAVYYAARHPQTVQGLILLSPPDNFGYQQANYAHRFKKDIAAAKKTAEESPHTLMPAEAYPSPITAASFLALFGNEEDTGMFTYAHNPLMKRSGLSKINCPLLIGFARKEEVLIDPPEVCIEAVRQALNNPGQLTAFILEETDHFYSGQEKKLAIKLADWLTLNFTIAQIPQFHS